MIVTFKFFLIVLQSNTINNTTSQTLLTKRNHSYLRQKVNANFAINCCTLLLSQLDNLLSRELQHLVVVGSLCVSVFKKLY